MPGYLRSEEEEPKLQNALTLGTSQQMAPAAPPVPAPQVINQDGKQYAFSPGKNGSLTAPAPVQQASLMPPEPQRRAVALPGMPPSVSPDEIAGYLGTQKQALDRFGPDAQMKLQSDLNNRQNSLGYKAADAGKGFADALMMGVARAGNPGWQNQFEGQENQYAQDQMNTLRNAGEANTRNVEGKMTLDRMDPNSVLSKTVQDSYGPLFKKLGYKPGDIGRMSAANIDNNLALMTQYGGKEVEAMIKQYELEMEKMRIGASLSGQESDERVATQKNKQAALEDYSKMPWYSRLLHPGISNAMEEAAGLNEPSYLATAKNSEGHRIGTKDGKTWEPI